MLKTDRILALDIGTSGIKLAEFAPGKAGAIELKNFAVSSLGLSPGEEDNRGALITSSIREMMRERNIKPGPTVVSVSGQAVFSRFVKLPPVEEDKVGQIVAYEAQQNVPFPIEEVVWDYQLIGTGEQEMDVMLVAIKGEIIEALTDAVENAGLRTELVDVSPMALYNAARFNYADLTTCTLIIDIGARSTDLIFLEENRVFIRSIPVAGNSITQQLMREFDISFDEAEQLKREHAFVGFGGAYEQPENEMEERISKAVRGVMTRMHAEINRSINFYRGQQAGSKPERVLLTGGTSVIPYTESFFREKLGVEVGYFNPFENVPVSDDIDTEEVARNVYVLGQVVGLALRRVLTCPIEISLMPPKVLAEQARRTKQPMYVLAGFGVVLVLLVWSGYFFKMGQFAKKRFELVDRQVQSLSGVKRSLEAVERQVQTLESDLGELTGLLPARTKWLDIVNEVRKAVPEGIHLTSFRPLQRDLMDPEMGMMAGGDEMMFGGFGEMMGGGLEGEGMGLVGAAGAGGDEIEITGLAFTDMVKTAEPIIRFRDALKASPAFSDATRLISQPKPQQGSVTRSFVMRIVLEEPDAEL